MIPPPKSRPRVDAQRPSGPQDGEIPSHGETIPQDIQLAASDLGPADVDLGDGHAGGLGEHEHLDVEDPALGVHVRYDVGQAGAGEELEAALGVLDAGGGRGSGEAEEEVEGVHEEVAEFGALRQGKEDEGEGFQISVLFLFLSLFLFLIKL